MSKVYRSPYEAYPFLADKSDDLRCDFEILTDKLCSGTGLLCSMVKDIVQNDSIHTDSLIYRKLVHSLTKIGELIYHMNPSLRTFCSITEEEVMWLKEEIDELRSRFTSSGFVLPQGCKEACQAHCLRTEGKELVRLIYRYVQQGNEVTTVLIDFANLISGYFFTLSLYLNYLMDVSEMEFISRNYKHNN